MSEYQKIEYIIGRDGKVTEKVIGGSGSDCVSNTSYMEAFLGEVSDRQLLPEYYENDRQIELTESENQYNQQG